jgi:hypothetical protein
MTDRIVIPDLKPIGEIIIRVDPIDSPKYIEKLIPSDADIESYYKTTTDKSMTLVHRLVELSDDKSFLHLQEALENRFARETLLFKDKRDRTPLYIASIKGNIRAVELILTIKEGIMSKNIASIYSTLEEAITKRIYSCRFFRENASSFESILSLVTSCSVKPCK